MTLGDQRPLDRFKRGPTFPSAGGPLQADGEQWVLDSVSRLTATHAGMQIPTFFSPRFRLPDVSSG